MDMLRQSLRSAFFALFYIAIFFNLSQNIYAGHSPDVDWRTIETENFRLIYPVEIEDEAQRIANLSEHYLKHNTKTMKPDWRKTTIVIISESAESNGAVYYAPYKSQYYNTPGLFANNEWFHALSVHEGRHMNQLNTINSDGRKFIWYVFGDMGAAVYTIAFIPSWILEGDAVLAETTLTSGGRGRTPNFGMFARANELSNDPSDRYSYYRAYMGSYNDNYPYADHYVLGYHMATYARRTYDPMIWNDTFRGMGGNIFRWDHFNYSFTKNNSDNLNITGLYQKTYNDLREKWLNQLEGLNFTDSKTVTITDSKRWNSFTQLNEWNNKLYAVRSGKDYLSGIVVIEPNGNRLIKQLPMSTALSGSTSNKRSVSFGGGKAVWTELLSDPRWQYRSYSSIMVYDLENDTSKRLFDRGKMISASISKDGKRIAAVEFTGKRICSLVIIDSASGNILKRIVAPDNSFLFDTAWSDDGTLVACAALNEDGNALFTANISTGTFTPVIPYTHKEQPKTPFFSGRRLFYGSDYSGIDNIYAIDLKSGNRYQVTSRKFGASLPSVNKKADSIFYSDYTVKGHRGEKMPLNPKNWVALANVPVKRVDYFEPVVSQEAGESVVDDVPQKNYGSEKYSPFMNSINIYSWSPIGDYGLGLIIISEDPLETTTIELGYHYNINEEAHSIRGSMKYSGLYPVLGVGGVYGDRAKSDANNQEKMITWRESTGYGSLYIPLNLSRGIHNTYMELGGSATYTEISDKSTIETNLRAINDGYFTAANYSGFLSHTIGGTLLDMYPRWGQMIQAQYKHTLHGDYTGEQLSLLSRLYFPSFFKHHSLRFEGSLVSDTIDYNRNDNYRFPLTVLYPRGYEEQFFEKLYKGSVNYTLPLFNTHFYIWKLLYFKRIKFNAFYDHGTGTYADTTFYNRSVGGELLFEYHPFSNKNIALDTGLRYSHLFDGKKPVYGLVIQIANGAALF
ncbi:MAG: hypothetical protein PF637_14530 [Spirochaetes bacterium]|jgi:hypothetical protein|nr:hypothetical protein [Spirochaetota bacterium]